MDLMWWRHTDKMASFGALLVECIWHVFAAILFLTVSPALYLVSWCRKGPKKHFKSILITGGNSGLGEALALSFAAPGVRLALIARDASKLATVAEACLAKGAQAEGFAGSVTDKAAMATLLLQLDEQCQFDLVIANAGVSSGTLGLKTIEESTYPLFDTNVNGVFNTIFPLLGRMRARKAGQIGIMASLASFSPLGAALEYHSSKAAVRFFAEAKTTR